MRKQFFHINLHLSDTTLNMLLSTALRESLQREAERDRRTTNLTGSL
jgi:hypothetical protein